MREAARIAVCVAIATVAGASEALAGYSGTIRSTFGARQSGMGGANRSLADDGMAPLYNPAGMAMQEGTTLSLDGGLILGHLLYDDPQNVERSGNEGGAAVGGFADSGIVVKLGNTPVAIGLGAYTYMGGRFKFDFTSTDINAAGEATNMDFTHIQQRWMPSIAVQIARWFSIGASYVRSYQTTAFVAPLQFQNTAEPQSLAGSHAILDLDTDGWGQGGVFGALLKIGEKTRVGASYTMPMRVSLKGRSEFTIRNSPVFIALGVPEGARTNAATTMRWKWPQVLGLGVSHEPNEKWLFAFDWQWIDWSWAADQVDISFYDGTDAQINGILNSIRNEASLRDGIKADLSDQFVYHFGTEYQATENVALRAGYIFMTNPVPNRTVRPFVPGIYMHTMTLGTGVKVAGWDVDLAWAHTFENEESVERSQVQGGEFDYSTFSNANDFLYAGLRKRF